MIRRQGWRFLLTIVAALMLPLAACDSSSEGRAERMLRGLEAQEPSFALLREHEPEAYQEFRALIEREMRQPNPGQSADFIRRGRAIWGQTVIRRLKTAPDQVIGPYLAYAAGQAKELEPHPQVCADILMERAGDVRDYVTPAMIERERGIYRLLFTTPAQADPRLATQADVETFMLSFLGEAPAALGLEEEKLLDALEGKGAPLDVCRTMGHFMRRLSEMPPDRSGPLFRLLTKLGEEAGPPGPGS